MSVISNKNGMVIDMFFPLSSWINRKTPIPERFHKKGYVDIPEGYYDGTEENTGEALQEADKLNYEPLLLFVRT